MKIETEANELVDVDVQFVSLVKRGANQVPFRYTKQEDGMIDLAKLFKTTTAAPVVSAILVAKGANLDAAKARIEAAGFSTETMENTDDGILFTQKDACGGPFTVIKFGDDVAVLMSNVAKFFESMNFDSTSFKEVMSQEGVFPSLHVAKSVLGATMMNIMESADSPSDAAELVGKAVDDFRTMVVGMVGNIPVEAFKLESEAALAAVAKATQPDGTKPVTDANVSNKTSNKVKKVEADAAAVAKAEADKKAAAKKVDEVDDKDKDKDKDDNDKIAVLIQKLGAIDTLLEGLKDVPEALASLTKVTDALATRVEEVATVAKSADDAVGGIVGGAAQDDDKPAANGELVDKSFHIDTAYTHPDKL